MSDSWIAFAQFLLPVLAGLLFILLPVRFLTLWQDQESRTWRNSWFACMYVAFFALCAARSANLPLPWVAISYMLLVLFLFPCVWCEWWDFIKFMREKNTQSIVEENAQRMTLDALAQADVHIALDATPVKHEGG